MLKHFTNPARKLMVLANEETQRLNHEYVGTEHILLALISDGSGTGAAVLRNLGLDLGAMRIEVEKLMKRGPDPVPTDERFPLTPRAKKVIEYASEEAGALNHSRLGVEHVLLGLLRERDGVAGAVLVNLGLRLDAARKEVDRVSIQDKT